MTEHLLNPEDVRIGATIRALSEAHGWRVGEFAAALGLSHSYLSNVMNGRKHPTPQLCRQIADLLHVPLAAIISGPEYAQAVAAAAAAQESE